MCLIRRPILLSLAYCAPRESVPLPDKADKKNPLVGVFTDRINGGESEEPRGSKCQPATVMEVLRRAELERLPPPPPRDTR